MMSRVLRLMRPAILLTLVTLGLSAADPSTLWRLVHDRCVVNQEQNQKPEPCARVDLAGGTVVLKDLVGKTQFLLLPTARVTGIEDAAILATDAPNYWAAAWRARDLVEQRAGRDLPRDGLSVVINSAYARSQNQLHIHVDCLRADVRAAIAAHLSEVGAHWAPFPVPLVGQRYRAMRLTQADLAGLNPFKVLNQTVPQSEMGRHTLAVVGVSFAGQLGFVLLDDSVDVAAGDFAHAEYLQDHDCTWAQP